MRALEIAFLLVNVPVLLWCLSARTSPAWVRLLPAVALLLMVSQVVVEGPRWQLYPGYLVTVWLFLSCTWPRWGASGILTGISGLGCLLGTAALGTILPIFEFPTPTGPFPIGSVTRHLVDRGREETVGRHPGVHRELMVQIWYPAERSGPRQAYRTRSESWFKKEHLALVRTHSTAGVPLARTRPRYPILIFSPSWTGRRNQNTFQAEELASHGFVVVGIDHPYATDLTVFPDGRTVRTTLGDWMDFSSDEALEGTIRNAEAQLRVRTADARFVLDEIERLDQFDPTELLTGRLDTDRVGIFGHSFGGAVAAEACRLDPRFRAGVDLDGYLFGESAKAGVEQPFFFMSDDTPIATASELANSRGPRHRYLSFIDRDVRDIRRSLETYGGYWMSVRGASHMYFCDSPLYSPVKRLTQAGPIDVKRAMRIINDYTLAFFNQHLNGCGQALLDGPSPDYPEARLEVWQPPER